MTCLHDIERKDFVEDPRGERVEGFIIASLRLKRAGPVLPE
jgi:hypothetical protein